MHLMTQIEKSVQSKLQVAEFNKRFSRMTRTMLATQFSVDPEDLSLPFNCYVFFKDNLISKKYLNS